MTRVPTFKSILTRTPLAKIELAGFEDKIKAFALGKSCALVVSSNVFVVLTADYTAIELARNSSTLEEGYLGKWFDLPLFSDMYFHPVNKCLKPNTIHVIDFTGDDQADLRIADLVVV